MRSMMPKRSMVESIIDWNERRGRSRIGAELLLKANDLERAWEQSNGEIGTDFADFIPIRLATIIEVYVRETVRDLVDSSEVLLDRAGPLLKDVKFDFLAAKSLYGRRITLGDIISHSIPVNSIEGVIHVYESLLPGFRQRLPKVSERWTEDDQTDEAKPILEDVDDTISVMKRLFEVRHILVHEFPVSAAYEYEEIPGFLSNTQAFLSAIDWSIISELKGDIPRTQLAMNNSATNELELEQQQLRETLEKVKEAPDVDIRLLKQSQKAWEKFADADAKLHAAIVAGGSMQPMVWAGRKAQLVSSRNEELQWWLDREEGEM